MTLRSTPTKVALLLRLFVRGDPGAALGYHEDVPAAFQGSILAWIAQQFTAAEARRATEVRKTPSWPRSWANFSLL